MSMGEQHPCGQWIGLVDAGIDGLQRPRTRPTDWLPQAAVGSR